VRIEVQDNGQGIPEENLTRIFAHGFTTRKNGHGFGLHISANAATEMKATLWAESAGPGRGATFILRLPMRAAETAAAA
jgi:signal transduction histidine kinase